MFVKSSPHLGCTDNLVSSGDSYRTPGAVPLLEYQLYQPVTLQHSRSRVLGRCRAGKCLGQACLTYSIAPGSRWRCWQPPCSPENPWISIPAVATRCVDKSRAARRLHTPINPGCHPHVTTMAQSRSRTRAALPWGSARDATRRGTVIRPDDPGSHTPRTLHLWEVTTIDSRRMRFKSTHEHKYLPLRPQRVSGGALRSCVARGKRRNNNKGAKPVADEYAADTLDKLEEDGVSLGDYLEFGAMLGEEPEKTVEKAMSISSSSALVANMDVVWSHAQGKRPYVCTRLRTLL